MKTTLSFTTPAELETESLVAIALDQSEKDATASNQSESAKKEKPQLKLATSDGSVQSVAADLLASGELTGRPFESDLLHKPAGLKAKRLLLISGGAAKKFTSYDLRRIAGAAVRTLKARGIRSFAFIAPPSIPAEEAVRAIVEGALVGNFDPDYYRSDRKDQKIDALTDRCQRQCGSHRAGKGRTGSADHRRVAELHARSGERAFQPHDADDSRRPREKDV